jgi:predicted TIM-barrel fold metal-dependent hydrolase
VLIDINVSLGHWAFRSLCHNTPQALLLRMDACRIDVAVVASIHGALYKDVHAANVELADAVRPYADRLIPFATLNPTYPGWAEDLRRCAEDLGMRGIRLYPQYHGYRIEDEPCLALVDAAVERGWPVQVPMRVVDRRQRHPWDLAEDLTHADIEAALSLRPDVCWMVLNAYRLDTARLPQDGDYLIDISRYSAVLQRHIQALIAGPGAAHVAFGTGLPFKTPEPALLKLQVLDAPPETVELIAWRNAARVLGLA